jgi:hypothetical protein
VNNASEHGRFALIPTHNRHELVEKLVRSLDGSVTDIVIIDNASDPEINGYDMHALLRDTRAVHVVYDREQPPNLSRMWNVGFDLIADVAGVYGYERWSVAVLNDDTELPNGWFTAVNNELRASQAVIACGALGPWIRERTLKTERDGSVVTRMTPHAFIIKGEVGLRADENLRWWWGDTDLDWQARAAGGVLILPGLITVNTFANHSTVGPLAEQAGRDRHMFAEKWGGNPW